MKLQPMMSDALSRCKARGLTAENIKIARKTVLDRHLYTKDPETYLAYVIVNGLYSPAEICKMYEIYNANDSHLMTFGKAIIKAVESGK